MSIDGWVGDVTYVTVACKGPRRFFDLDAVRSAPYERTQETGGGMKREAARVDAGLSSGSNMNGTGIAWNQAGAPPLDWHIDNTDYTPPPAPEGDPMPLEYRIGDVFDELDKIPDGTIDLIVTSPPFLALRSYLPADHPDKGKEIGSEATPAAFIDTLLALTAEFGRVLAPHGSLCVELGDTYSHEGPGKPMTHATGFAYDYEHTKGRTSRKDAAGWPLAKSLTGIPQAYMLSLAYGINVLTGQPSPAGKYRIRNQIVWARPNPPVGALGDKFRPATSYITVACRGARRFFDLDAVRTEHNPDNHRPPVAIGQQERQQKAADNVARRDTALTYSTGHPAGAPPLDWHTDMPDEDGDWLWKLSTQPYRGAHYATFPLELPTRLIKAMCPLRVCVECGRPSERIVETSRPIEADDSQRVKHANGERPAPGRQDRAPEIGWQVDRETVGWSDCGCLCYSCRNGGCPDCGHKWRTGVVLDPFCGSGTTLEAAQNVGRHAIGIDLDPRCAELAQSRCGMFMEVTG